MAARLATRFEPEAGGFRLGDVLVTMMPSIGIKGARRHERATLRSLARPRSCAGAMAIDTSPCDKMQSPKLAFKGAYLAKFSKAVSIISGNGMLPLQVTSLLMARKSGATSLLMKLQRVSGWNIHSLIN